MKLSSYLSERVIIPNIVGNNMNELVEDLLDKVIKNNQSLKLDKHEINKAVLKREEEASTYLGYGVALPHARLENFEDILVVIGFLEKPIKVKNLANQEEDLKVVILVVADVLKGKKILKIMSGISKLALKNRQTLDEIIEKKSATQTIKLLDQANIEIDHNITAEDLFTNLPKPASIKNTLEDIAKRIIMEKVSGIPVVNENNRFLGEITERELIAFGMPKYTTILDDLNFMTIGEPFENYIVNEKTTTIEEIYRKDGVITVDKEASLMEVCYLFMNRGVTRIYVVENGKYLGIILRSDIIRKILHI
ncbi:CBS domain-containing protein [Cetobacterium sp. 8H]|uniref:CBS domain-containing protein n=1 Tax=Cetobacterium sp. 8H TaxID=2759681 RepID=UPI00163C2BC8|nr:CBS domain-containing protein [Cetobacterium sp. 8H]MBC2850891.1 CBS domain-containing protein [Cetobacterium sp. 8H]